MGRSAQRRARRLAPQVVLLSAPDKSLLPVPRARNLADAPGGGVRIVRSLAPGTYDIRLRDFHLDGVERDEADD